MIGVLKFESLLLLTTLIGGIIGWYGLGELLTEVFIKDIFKR